MQFSRELFKRRLQRIQKDTVIKGILKVLLVIFLLGVFVFAYYLYLDFERVMDKLYVRYLDIKLFYWRLGKKFRDLMEPIEVLRPLFEPKYKSFAFYDEPIGGPLYIIKSQNKATLFPVFPVFPDKPSIPKRVFAYALFAIFVLLRIYSLIFLVMRLYF